MYLDGKSLIITGGVTGIGKATVLAAASQGAKVVSMSIQAPDSNPARELLDSAGEPVRYLQVDVTDVSQVKAAFEEALEFLGTLDCMINCAGNEQVGPAETLTSHDFLSMYSVHVLGTANTNVAALTYMKKNGGSIVNIASFAGVCGMPNMAAYSAAKGAVIAYTRCVAKEWGPLNVRVNAVCPSAKTELYYENRNKMTEDERAAQDAFLKASVPLGGRVGTTEDCANMNLFLASDMSRFITGQTLAVDGGLMMAR